MTTLTDRSSPLLEVDASPEFGEYGNDFGGYRDEVRAEPNYRALALGWVVIATLVRLWIARLPLGNGEAYYYSWSRFLDWSYYDHPPLLAWVVRLTTALGTSPATVRLGPVLAAGVTGYLLYRLAERWFRPRAAFFALVVFTALPVFLFSSFVVNPEALLAPLWIGFLLTVDGMRDRNEPVRPLLAGLLLGLAFLAKYTAVLLVPASLIYIAMSMPMRRWLRRPSFYAGGAVALALAMPVLVWNQTRGWPSLRLHLVERVGVGVPVAGENTLNTLVEISSSQGSSLLQSVGRVLVGQLLAYSPLLAPLLVMVLVQSFRRARREDRALFITAFSLPVLLPLLAAMVQLKDAEMHWTMVAFIPAAIGVGGMLDKGWETAKRTRTMAVAGVGLTAVAFLLANIHASSPAVLRLLPRDHYDPRADMINELVGWDQVRASVAQAANSAPGTVVLAANHYALCGRLMFEMGDDPQVFCPTARRTAYDFFDRREPPPDATVIALTTDIHEELPAGLTDRKCSVSDQVDVERGGRHVARYFVQSCPPVRHESEERASRD